MVLNNFINLIDLSLNKLWVIHKSLNFPSLPPTLHPPSLPSPFHVSLYRTRPAMWQALCQLVGIQLSAYLTRVE